MPMTRWFRRAALLPLAAAILTGCEWSAPQSTLDTAGPVAQAQMDLLVWSYWLSWPVIIGVLGVLVYVIVRFRERKGEDRIPVQFHGNTLTEIGLTIVPVLIVIAVAVPTVRAIFATENRVEPTGDDVIINVTGYQWWWRFEYPELGVVTANELHVPAGRRVILNLESADVLHSFWVPRLAGKRDLIPNQNNQLWLIADEPGVYYGQCGELCLGAHAYMKKRVIAQSDEDFAAWAESFATAGERTVQDDPQVAQGRELFSTKGCTNCHTVDGIGSGFQVGSPDFPNLTNFGQRLTLAAGVRENTQENLEAWLRDPQSIKPGNYMPRLWRADDENADEEIAAVAAFLLSLGAEPAAQAQASLGGSHGDR